MAKRIQKNRVGHQIPSSQEAQEIMQLVKTLKERTQPLGPTLNKEERIQLSTPRHGSEEMIEIVLKLAEAKGLRTAHVDVEGVRADQALVEVLEPLFRELEVVYHTVWDVLRQARSEMWEGTLTLYGILGTFAAHDPEVALALRPATAFMAAGPRARKEEPSEA